MSQRLPIRRQILAFLDTHPVFDALIELLVVVLFAFSPICLGAFFVLTKDQEFLWQKFGSLAYMALAKGEFIFLSIGLGGSVVWLVNYKLESINRYAKIFTNLFLLLILQSVCVLILASRSGTDEPMAPWLFNLTATLYSITLIIYFFALYAQRNDSSKPENANPNAKTILEKAGRGQ